jgi:outer membrane receptor protein involved in Fe transport
MNSTGNSMTKWGKNILLGSLLMLCAGWLAAQTGTISGRAMDANTQDPLPFAKVTVEGTYYGTLTDEQGNFVIKDVKPGDYTVVVFMDEYGSTKYTGITVKADKVTPLDVKIGTVHEVGGITIVGEADLIDVTDGKSGTTLGSDYIQESSYRNVSEVIENQAGVSKTPDGLQIRGGRVYETSYLVEGISARDPLAGTGMGVSVAANSVEEIDLVTGGGDAEFGNGTAGVINTKIKEGGDRLQVKGSWQRDNLGFKPHGAMSWNTDVANLSISGPVPFTKKKLTFFASGDMDLSDDYFKIYANQLHSTAFSKNDSVWAPRQSNSWANTVKLGWSIRPGMKFTLTNQHSLNINQNSRTLQVVGNNAIMQPGFPYAYSLNLDNATVYTHQSNLTILNFKTLIDTSWTLDVSAGRLFTYLQADANGRAFRDSTVDQIYDPQSIVTDPVSVFNPGDSVAYVYPSTGLYNNNGIGTLWHNHHAQEYTFKYKFTHQSKSGIHYLTLGQEHKEQEYQWVDVTRPWVGAPIRVNDTTYTPSTSLGSSSDFWLARPSQGGFFVQDEIRYNGIIGFIGLRYDYWAPGKFADNAVANPDAPVTDATRAAYLDHSTRFMGKQWKARLLPKLRVSFPVTENNVLYFNYGHATQLPHPRFVYAGLDPVYQDRSFLSNLGNPNLNPEVTVSYEVGIKSKINKNLAVTLTAFYNDKFDYIVSRNVLIKDQTGRFVQKTFFINQDYARIRGLEVGIKQRLSKVLMVTFNGTYQIATGKSNTAAESALQIKTQGFVNTSKENYLAWDRPFDLKASMVFKPDTSIRVFGVSLNGFRAFVSSTLKSGLRYTPYEQTGVAANGRPIYEIIQDAPFSKVAAPWFWTDVRVTRDLKFGKTDQYRASLSFEVRNVFNNRNSQIINPVTGKAYRSGDPLPFTVRDPSYPDPQDSGLPPTDPARFMTPRQMMLGLSFLL